jgi:hypothetical protein
MEAACGFAKPIAYGNTERIDAYILPRALTPANPGLTPLIRQYIAYGQEDGEQPRVPRARRVPF